PTENATADGGGNRAPAPMGMGMMGGMAGVAGMGGPAGRRGGGAAAPPGEEEPTAGGRAPPILFRSSEVFFINCGPIRLFSHKSGNPVTRREALRRVGNGFGMMAFAGMLGGSLAKASPLEGDSAKLDYPQRVKRVIFLFMNGGCSSIDSFDPKPMLEKYD